MTMVSLAAAIEIRRQDEFPAKAHRPQTSAALNNTQSHNTRQRLRRDGQSIRSHHICLAHTITIKHDTPERLSTYDRS